MKQMLENLRPLGDGNDSVPVHGLMPAKMKDIEDMADRDDDFDPCRCQGLLLGVLLGSLGWAIPLLIWWLL